MTTPTPEHLYRGVLPEDTNTEVLITVWTDGTAEIATRPKIVSLGYRVWSPPNKLEEYPHD